MKKTIFLTLLLLFISKKNDLSAQQIKIGTQTWSTKNLDVSTFANGDKIPEAKTKKDWLDAGLAEKPVWCYYNYNDSTGKKYGKLYNWFAVNDPRGLAPKGWRIPTNIEWSEMDSILIRKLDGEEVLEQGSEAGIKIKSIDEWLEKGNNKSGFTALPGGVVDKNGEFYGQGSVATWWSSTKNGDHVFYYALYSSSSTYVNDDGVMMSGYAVRCLKTK